MITEIQHDGECYQPKDSVVTAQNNQRIQRYVVLSVVIRDWTSLVRVGTRPQSIDRLTLQATCHKHKQWQW